MKFNHLFKIFFHVLSFIFLTILTQIGGLIYILTICFISSKKKKYRLKRFVLFLILYSVSTFLLIPKLAPSFGRVKIEDNHSIEAHSFFTKLCNRNYVVPEMHESLINVSLRLQKVYPNLKLIYLDANFPLFDGFPLLPHLSHNDGKKIDISFIYKDQNNRITNTKPSRSGYGIFVAPLKNEINQPQVCRERGYWQYDSTKYLTFGSLKKDLILEEHATKRLIQFILNENNVQKLFIEPHLKKRFNLNHSKIRFHGCQAVRHDDHIHFQIK